MGSKAAEPFYDARRGVYYAKPVLRGWLHLLCFGASLVLGPAAVGKLRASHCAAVFSAAGELGGHGLAAELGQLRPRSPQAVSRQQQPTGKETGK